MGNINYNFVFDTNNHKFGVIQNILEISYKSLVESVLTFNLTSWYGHLYCKQKHILAMITNIGTNILIYH